MENKAVRLVQNVKWHVHLSSVKNGQRIGYTFRDEKGQERKYTIDSRVADNETVFDGVLKSHIHNMFTTERGFSYIPKEIVVTTDKDVKHVHALVVADALKAILESYPLFEGSDYEVMVDYTHKDGIHFTIK